MNATRRSAGTLVLAVVLLAAGAWLWILHARAQGVGRVSPVLAYDAAQHALAARELAEHGKLATTFALPIELVRHPHPPWPLALVQPGLVVVEAALFQIAGPARESMEDAKGRSIANDPERRHWLVVVLPFASFLATGLLLGLVSLRLLARHAPELSGLERVAAGAVVGFCFLLDPEAQHFAAGGFSEPPFTLGLIGALALLALGIAPQRPFAFGLILGVTGAFRGNMLWLAPILAGAAALLAARERRLKVAALSLLGYALPLVPWWVYKWHAFGTPAWDLSWVSLWDGVGGQTWFSLNHVPALPSVPDGPAALAAIAHKMANNLPPLLLDLSVGPRALWLGALLIWALATRPLRGPVVAGLAALCLLAVSVAVAAVSVPLLRYVFPTRVAMEAGGVLALWALVARVRAPLIGANGQRALRIGIAVIGLTWGGLQTVRGMNEVRAGAAERGVPSTQSMTELASRLDHELPAGEPVMSNLGPVLAWFARRPVVHLALSPEDVEACRRRLDLRHVVLVFREPARAWDGWAQVLERPGEAARNPEWNITRVRNFETHDGFIVVWLELGPLAPRLAARAGRGNHFLSTR